MTDSPILYSFRRCPYAMRARMAVAVSGVRVELREVVLRDKPAEMLEASENRGGAVKKRDEVHRMAEANKAFAHFRF